MTLLDYIVFTLCFIVMWCGLYALVSIIAQYFKGEKNG